jgi:hypothetical protein
MMARHSRRLRQQSAAQATEQANTTMTTKSAKTRCVKSSQITTQQRKSAVHETPVFTDTQVETQTAVVLPTINATTQLVTPKQSLEFVKLTVYGAVCSSHIHQIDENNIDSF